MTPTELAGVVTSFAAPGQPQAAFDAADHVIHARFGRAWTTVLLVRSSDFLRIYSSDPAASPLRGTKPIAGAIWAEPILRDQSPFLADGAAALTAAYEDHAIPLGLGVVRIANIPVVFDGKLRAVLCLNGAAEHEWGPDFLPGVGLIATAIAPVLACCHPA